MSRSRKELLTVLRRLERTATTCEARTLCSEVRVTIDYLLERMVTAAARLQADDQSQALHALREALGLSQRAIEKEFAAEPQPAPRSSGPGAQPDWPASNVVAVDFTHPWAARRERQTRRLQRQIRDVTHPER